MIGRRNGDDAVFAERVWLNGEGISRLYVEQVEIIGGGDLVFEMGGNLGSLVRAQQSSVFTQLTERMHDAAVFHKTDRELLYLAHQSLTAV